MRVTQKYLLSECNRIFKKLEIEVTAIDITKTYYRTNDYEGGAAHFIVTCGDAEGKPLPLPLRLNIYYPIWYLQKELNNGYELYLKLKDNNFLFGAEFDIRQPLTPTTNQ